MDFDAPSIQHRVSDIQQLATSNHFPVSFGQICWNCPRRRLKIGFVFLDTDALSLGFLQKNWVRFVISPPMRCALPQSGITPHLPARKLRWPVRLGRPHQVGARRCAGLNGSIQDIQTHAPRRGPFPVKTGFRRLCQRTILQIRNWPLPIGNSDAPPCRAEVRRRRDGTTIPRRVTFVNN